MVIGITGGIATGKSTVASLLKAMDYIVIDADKIARDIVRIGEPAYELVVRKFGSSFLNEDKTIDRKALGKEIFSNEISRLELNSIMHPYIFKTIKEEIMYLSKKNRRIFVDIPLLFEEIDKYKEYQIDFNEIWLVYADESTQLKRLIKRDSLSEIEGLKRISSQMSIEKKKRLATRIIDNLDDLSALKDNLNKALKSIE